MNGTTESYGDLAELLREKGEFVTTVSGVSMWPMLRYRKDPVLIHPVRAKLKRYDIAVYSKSNKYVVHRVLGERDNCYVIRGDNCLAKEYVPEQNVIGVVTGFWRFGRFIDVSNVVYGIYARVWVALNPLVHLARFAKSKSAAVSRLLFKKKGAI